MSYINLKSAVLFISLFVGTMSFAQIWTLEQCIDTALVNNNAVKILENQNEIALLKNKEVKANLIPKVTANGEYKYFVDLPYQLMPLSVFGGPDGQFKEAQFGVPHNINGNLTIQIPIYSAKLYGAIDKTEIAINTVDLQIQKTKEQIYFEVSALYRNAQLLMNKELFLESSISNTEKVLDNVKQLQEALLATGTDVKKVALQLSILNSQRDQIESKTTQVLNGLKLYMGLSMDFDLAIDPLINLTTTQTYDTKPSLEIGINRFQQELVTADIKSLQKSRYIPDVGIVGYLGTNGYGYDVAPNDFLNFYPLSFVGLKVSYPLFNGTVTNKQISQKRIEHENLQLQEATIVDKTNLGIYNAQENLKVALDQIEIRLAQVALAEEIYSEVDLQHQQGIASTLDVIQADNELRQTKQNYLTAVIESIVADLELQKITGNILK
ncbi:MAG: TolC family protein [Crocinitomix sp.]|nr:TolC family protein [Crocinitomix sp.]